MCVFGAFILRARTSVILINRFVYSFGCIFCTMWCIQQWTVWSLCIQINGRGQHTQVCVCVYWQMGANRWRHINCNNNKWSLYSAFIVWNRMYWHGHSIVCVFASTRTGKLCYIKILSWYNRFFFFPISDRRLPEFKILLSASHNAQAHCTHAHLHTDNMDKFSNWYLLPVLDVHRRRVHRSDESQFGCAQCTNLREINLFDALIWVLYIRAANSNNNNGVHYKVPDSVEYWILCIMPFGRCTCIRDCMVCVFFSVHAKRIGIAVQ